MTHDNGGDKPTSKFLHHDPEFRDLLETVAATSPLKSVAMVEKDYWIAHTLWALHRLPLTIIFKGGTSLSKAFQITNRFSEDIDLVVEPGTWTDLPHVDSWHSSGPVSSKQRKLYWENVVARLDVPDVPLELDHGADETYRNVKVIARYPGHHVDEFKKVESTIRPWVLIELTHNDPDRLAVAPATDRPITSYVHEFAAANESFDQGGFVDTRLVGVQCVHPALTLLEKLDAITRRYDRDKPQPAAFARHYEDAARIIGHLPNCDQIPGGIDQLAREMFKKKQLRKLVTHTDPAFQPEDSDRWKEVQRAHDALRPMFWADQMPLTVSTTVIREWLSANVLEESALDPTVVTISPH